MRPPQAEDLYETSTEYSPFKEPLPSSMSPIFEYGFEDGEPVILLLGFA